MADQRKDHVLRGDAKRKLALEPHAHGLGPTLDQRLRRQHMRQLARSDAEGERAQPAMGAGMAVAADDQAARQAQAQFGPDDMNDALAGLVDIEQPDAGWPRFRPATPPAAPARSCWCRRGHARSRSRDPASRRSVRDCEPARLRFLRSSRPREPAEIVQQMTVDMQQIGILAEASDDMLVPDLGQQGAAGRLHCRILPFFLFYGRLMRRHRPFCTACHSGLRPNSLPMIKTYRSPWANV